MQGDASWLSDPSGGAFVVPAVAEEDDWLAGVLQNEDDVPLRTLSPANSGELASLFNPPPSMQHRNMYSMQHRSFSTGDLQSLGAPMAPGMNAWKVSAKPMLQSVPELGPAEPDSLAAYARSHLFSDGLEYLDADALAPANMLPRPMSALAASPGGSMDMHGGAGPSTGHAYGAGAHGMAAYGAPGGLVMGVPAGYAMGQASGLHAESPEHAMTDVKLEQAAGPSQGLGMPPQLAQQQQQQPFQLQQQHQQQQQHVQLQQQHQHQQQLHPGYLAPSGGGMRKSHSAVELGAWKKMAEGNLDGVDPSGSVREMLQGLDMAYAIGKLTPQERLQKILRYRAKRQMRNFKPAVKYQCRKSLADTRPRVRGRFARDNEPGSVMPHETKKAIREKGGDAAAPVAASAGGAAQTLKAGEAIAASETALPPPAPVLAGLTAAKAEQQPAAAVGPGSQASGSTAAAQQAGQQQPAQQNVLLQQQAQQEQQPADEHHASALAHLYCQWSEVPPA